MVCSHTDQPNLYTNGVQDTQLFKSVRFPSIHLGLKLDVTTWLQVHITKPTWSNHHNIFNDAGVGKKEYRYYKPETKGLDFEGLIDDLKVSIHCTQPAYWPKIIILCAA